MNQKKILIVSLLVLFVAAMSLSAVSASSIKTKTLKIDKKTNVGTVDLKNGDTLQAIYAPTNGQYDKGVNVLAACYKRGIDNPKRTTITKVKVYFKKGSKVKTKVSTKIKYDFVKINLIKGYTPNKVKIWYKTK